LGVRPSKPGFTETEIAPLFGALRHLEGAVPTPKGMIEIALDRDRGGEVTLPAGVDATLRFEDAPLRGAQLGPGRHLIERA
ncbi:MAG: alpha-L-rhamnosidase C-terminal domain-containing protein, partial [Candidatus Binataceae bacterium]